MILEKYNRRLTENISYDTNKDIFRDKGVTKCTKDNIITVLAVAADTDSGAADSLAVSELGLPEVRECA
jgi:hypothetical protein